jgi:4-hydroxybenzoyl-CoA thioesterase
VAGDGSRPYVAVRTLVRWGDCDPAGIAFYPRFFEWMDQVSHRLAREMGVSARDMLPPLSYGFPLIKADAQFLAPAYLDDQLEVRTTVSQIGKTSLTLRHEIVRLPTDGQVEVLLARGSESRVYIRRVDDGSMRPQELTAAMRAVLERYLEPSEGARGELQSG